MPHIEATGSPETEILGEPDHYSNAIGFFRPISGSAQAHRSASECLLYPRKRTSELGLLRVQCNSSGSLARVAAIRRAFVGVNVI